MATKPGIAGDIEYGLNLISAALNGARAAEESALEGRGLPYLMDNARDAMKVAAAGACLGLLGYRMFHKRSPLPSAIAFGTLAFCAGLTLKTRDVGSTIVNSARKEIDRVRDERWLEDNPINYA